MNRQSGAVPKVTVLMTLYNKGPFVEEAIRSVLDGSYTDLELLVVDDASTDDGPAVVQAMNDPRIRFIPTDRNRGRAASANRGYELALGEYIAVLDADDKAHPDRLSKQVAYMDAHPEIGVSGTSAQCFGASGRLYHWPLTDRECRAMLLFTDPVLYGSSIIRRSVLMTHGIRSREGWALPGEDYLMLLALSQVTQFGNLPETLLYYRIGEQNQRHGRDLISDRAVLCKEAFMAFDMPVTDAQLELHLLFYKLSRTTITTQRLREFKRWTEELKQLNHRLERFDRDVFDAEVDRRWDALFHFLPDHGIAPSLLHMWISQK